MIRKEYLFPNLITLMAMFAGFYSVVASLNGEFVIAAYATLLAFVFDGLDGKVARMLNASSDFGIQLDSLSDLISFGVAPAILVYRWALEPFGRIGWMAAFLYVACGALRLARFNVQTKTISSKYFVGLPIPAAAGAIASSVLFANEVFGDPTNITVPIWFSFLIYLLAFLMVSSVPYYSFKNIEAMARRPFNVLVMFVLLLFVLGLYPEIMLFVIATVYITAGLVTLLLRKKRLSPSREEQADTAG